MTVHFTLRVVQVHSQLRFCWFLFEKRGKYDNLFTPKTARKTCRYYLERSIFCSYPTFFPTNLHFDFSSDQSVSNLFCLKLCLLDCFLTRIREQWQIIQSCCEYVRRKIVLRKQVGFGDHGFQELNFFKRYDEMYFSTLCSKYRDTLEHLKNTSTKLIVWIFQDVLYILIQIFVSQNHE